jgi:BMFP domain-containing protein YqiC
MTPLNVLEDIAARVAKALADSPAADLEKNLRASLAGLFSRLDLVTREEYDVQATLLARAQERLALLEARLTKLESTDPRA